MKNKNLRPVLTIYEESALFWDEHRRNGPFYEKKYLDWILKLLSPGDEILDVGCGSGFPIANYFLTQHISVTGIDGSQEMIKIAKYKLPQGNWSIQDMRSLSLNKKYKALIAWDSFFHLTQTEQEKMFRLFQEHLEPQGILLFTSGTEYGEAIGDMNGHPLFHASWSIQEYQSLLKQNGFEVVDLKIQDPDCGGRTVWYCRLKAPRNFRF